jgi:hypothetical protein
VLFTRMEIRGLYWSNNFLDMLYRTVRPERPESGAACTYSTVASR